MQKEEAGAAALSPTINQQTHEPVRRAKKCQEKYGVRKS
jgi:hypothetical protein